MLTLLHERFAPITSSIGYLRAPLAESFDALMAWRKRLGNEVRAEDLSASLSEALPRLAPLTAGARPRELLVSASDGWTAYFDCSLRGTDAVTTIGYLSQKLGTDGLAIRTIPHTAGLPGVTKPRYGSTQLEMFGPTPAPILNHLRSIAVAHDGSRWVFVAAGTPQPFEDARAYRARRTRDRFNSCLLAAYCRSIGVDPFTEDSYGPEAVLIHTSMGVPPGGLGMEIAEVQEWLGIVEGMADALPG